MKTKRSLAHDAHDSAQRIATKYTLKYPPVRFEENQRNCIAGGIEQACIESKVELYAVAIGFDHGHAVLGRHERSVEQIVQHFKSRATQQMNRSRCHPLAEYRNRKDNIPTPWSEGCWSVFINDRTQLQNAIEYVERHPMKEGLAPQNWSFVKPLPV